MSTHLAVVVDRLGGQLATDARLAVAAERHLQEGEDEGQRRRRRRRRRRSRGRELTPFSSVLSVTVSEPESARVAAREEEGGDVQQLTQTVPALISLAMRMARETSREKTAAARP